jgi:hypothetical protein
MPRFRISRRAVLKGTLGGAAISFGLPPLEAMFNANGTALAQGAALPRRMGIFFWGGGIKKDRWNPTTTGAAWTLSPALEPLAPVKEYINVVTGMDVKTPRVQGHHSGAGGILSGVPLVVQPKGNAPFRSTLGGPSVDQVAAAVIGKDSKFKSLEVGISSRINGGEGTTLQYLSHNGPDSPNPPEYDPAKVYDRIFGMGFVPPGGGAPSTPVVDVTLGLRRSVIDAVLADLNGLRARVSTADKVRLDQHMANLRTIENRLATTKPSTSSGVGCKLPTRPSAVGDTRSKEMLEERTQLMSDLIALAFACDQTRVFSMMFSGPTNSTIFWQVNATEGHHNLTHDEPGDQPLVQACTVFTMKCFGSLVQSLKAIPEGAGNLLDNTVIYGSSDVSDGKLHDQNDYPLVVAGKGGGFLKYPGVHYRSPNRENTSTVLLSVLRAAGLELTQFGAAGGQVSASCGAIEQ